MPGEKYLGRVIVARSAQEMDGIRSAWESLHREGKHTLFQCFDWSRSAAHIFTERESPAVIFAETPGGMAILPAAINRESVTLLGEELFDYREVLSEGDHEAVALAWKTLGDICHAVEREFRVKGVRESSLDDRFRTNADARAKTFDRQFFADAPSVRCGDPVSGRKHPRLERNVEKLKAADCEMKVASGHDARLIREVLTLKAKQICQMAANVGDRCEIFSLTSGSAIAAALITFIDGPWRRLYTTYYDARWAKHSPGVSLVNHVIRLSVDAGMDVDLMTGEQPYKQRFATFKEALFTLRASACDLRAISVDAPTEVPLAA
jgi:CelD/BcsL family acetyltransferase involved in cellulose biosynthesis